MTDPIADMITRIRNGQQARLFNVLCPHSKLRENVLFVLKDEGYISDYKKVEKEKNKPTLEITLKYVNGQPAIKEINRKSRPGRRCYKKINKLQKVYNGLGVAIISTSHGVMSDFSAFQKNIGGEVLCEVF